MPHVLVVGVEIGCGGSVSGDPAFVEKRRQNAVGFEGTEIGRDLGTLGRDGAPVVHRDSGQPGSAEFQIQVGGVAVFVGDMQEDVLAAHRVWFGTVELVADCRRDLEPGGPGAHDRIDLGGPQSAGRGVVGTGGARVGVGAGQDLARACQAVLGDDLVADPVPADVVEALDTEVGDELSGMPTAGGVLDGWCRHGVVHDDCQLVGVVDSVGLYPHGGELQIDQDGHIDVDHDGFARRHRAETGLAGEDLFDDGHAHDGSLRAYLVSSSSHSAIPTKLKKSAGLVGSWAAMSLPLSSQRLCSIPKVACVKRLPGWIAIA